MESVSNITTVTFNYMPEDIIKEEHICYYSVGNMVDGWSLIQVYRETIKHPEAPEDAVVYNINTRVVREGNKDRDVADIKLLKYAQDNSAEMTRLKYKSTF